MLRLKMSQTLTILASELLTMRTTKDIGRGLVYDNPQVEQH